MHLKLQSFLKLIGIKKVIRKIISYGFQSMIENNPLIYKKIMEAYEKEELNKIKNDINNKGRYLTISRNIKIIEPRGLIIGNNVHIGENSYLNCRGGISIGSNTQIGSNVNITTSKSNYEGICLPFDSTTNDHPVRIGNNVYIDDNVSILPGVTIGEGAVIKSGLVISNDIPERAIVSINESYKITYRDEDTYSRLNNLQSYGGIRGRKLPLNEIEKYSKNLNEDGKNVFFVLGTGRSGSTTIAKALSKHNNIACFHEPKLQLIRISTKLLHGEISQAEAAEELRKLYIKDTKTSSLIYGESDQKLSNLIGLIHKIMPKAKFIWLIREPVKTVNSTYSRGWFSNNEMEFEGQNKLDSNLYAGIYSDYRPRGDLSGYMSKDEWLDMSEFERNCWYWYFWNQNIMKELDLIDSKLWIKVRLEELGEKINSIYEFLDVQPINSEVSTTNKAPPKYELLTDEKWTTAMHSSFNKWCDKQDLY
ncbi:sulfotransferase [Colwellia sp. MB02u-9]|uniref:sulfotransferase n=1 Tax=Colwellia sp. MB02u-9 TaxID=2759823 RepID=UPI0015F6C4CC|nr:sulfotransferase [Colwellia sp. MB02u-9]MBA6295150.1 sulfotransferase [Colwellia sp. MB02u-9]